MVGKGELKNSRIFQQCYVKCCKLQNLSPITHVMPSGNGKVVDFCVDRIKYLDWAPILHALSCDMSLQSISIRCRQQVKTVLEHVDCEKLAKNVNKRAVILTRFMLNNFVEALSQCLPNTTFLASLLLEGFPLRAPYLNPFIEALHGNNSLQHLCLPRCLIGDAGCLGICKALRNLPNVLTLDLSVCELTSQGAIYISELVKFQKIHRYSENWKHTLRYRLPQLDSMAGLRRITLCGNTNIGDCGATSLMDVLLDDLWIKALDLQNCGLSEESAQFASQLLSTNSNLTIIDLRCNPGITPDSLAQVRVATRENENGFGTQQYRWLNSSSNVSNESRIPNQQNLPPRSMTATAKQRFPPTPVGFRYKLNVNNNSVKKEKDYVESLEEQLQEEISHRQQLEEINSCLVDQVKQMKQLQLRIWTNDQLASSGSEQSCNTSDRSFDFSSSSETSSTIPIDQNTLSYIQQAFKDIYSFIKNNQCVGKCQKLEQAIGNSLSESNMIDSQGSIDEGKLRLMMMPKKAKSAQIKIIDEVVNNNKLSKSECLISDAHKDKDYVKQIQNGGKSMLEKNVGDTQRSLEFQDGAKLLEELLATKKSTLQEEMFESQNEQRNFDFGDTKVSIFAKNEVVQKKSSSKCGSSETLVCSPSNSIKGEINPRDIFYSSSEESL